MVSFWVIGKIVNNNFNGFQAAGNNEIVDVPTWDNTTAPNSSEKGTTTNIIEAFDEDKHCDARLGDHVVIVTRWFCVLFRAFNC